jgi:hypothetical protein
MCQRKEGRALRTETTINDTRDFDIGKRLVNLPALREIGFKANRRLLGVQRLDHDPISATRDLHTLTDPVTTKTGTVHLIYPSSVSSTTAATPADSPSLTWATVRTTTVSTTEASVTRERRPASWPGL